MKRKLLYILILSLLLVPASFVKAANDVTLTSALDIQLTSPATMNFQLENGNTFRTMTVTASTIAITVSAGGRISLISTDGYDLSNDQGILENCDGGTSRVVMYVAAGAADRTITFSPTTAVKCSSTNSGTTGGGGGGGGGAATPSEPAQTTSGTQTVSQTINGAAGGSVTTSDQRAGVTVPAGLSGANISLSIVPQNSSGYTAPISGYAALAGQVYDYSCLANGTALTAFSKSVSLVFKYSESDIAGLNEDSLQVYYWDTANNKWVLVGGIVDKVNHTITANVNHFTVFGVFGEKTSDETAGDLIKLQCPAGANVNHVCKSVYYLGSNNKRYVFPNEITYKSWYADFSSVKTVSSEVMAAYSIGGNVTMRPGTYLIKITTDPKVYAVEPGGKLRWVDSETTAQNLYGANWIKKIVDVSDAFFINYDNSNAAENKVSNQHPVGSLIKYSGEANKYYVANGNVKRLFTGSGFGLNGLRDEFVLETDITYNDGANISATESTLNTTAGP